MTQSLFNFDGPKIAFEISCRDARRAVDMLRDNSNLWDNLEMKASNFFEVRGDELAEEIQMLFEDEAVEFQMNELEF